MAKPKDNRETLSLELLLFQFATELIKNVSVQTHTDWSSYTEKTIKKWKPIIEKNLNNLK